MLGSSGGRAGAWRARKFLLKFGLVSDASDRQRRRDVRLYCLTAVVALGGCASGGGAPQTSMAPMFPESKWGVSASTRVASLSEPIPKGGGVYKVGDPYQVGGLWYDPREQPDYDRIGIASWYGADFHGRRTANGEIYDMNALTAAHPTLPIPSYAYVTNLANGRTILLRINDRGPYVADRVIDLSQRSAKELGLHQGGTGRVRVKYAGRAPLDGNDFRERQFLASGGQANQQRYADAGQPWSEPARRQPAPTYPAAPPYSAPPRQSYHPAYSEPAWQPPREQASARQAWAYNDTTAAAPQGYGSPQGWSPAAYRAGLARR